MVAINLRTGSSSIFNTLQYSGTQFIHQGAIGLTLLCALSGLAIIPVLCDSTGRIGSVF